MHVFYIPYLIIFVGHSDVLMGVTILKNDELAERLRFIQFAAGAVPGPFDCYLVNRGLKTLHGKHL